MCVQFCLAVGVIEAEKLIINKTGYEQIIMRWMFFVTNEVTSSFLPLLQKDGSTLVTVEHVEKILPQLVSERWFFLLFLFLFFDANLFSHHFFLSFFFIVFIFLQLLPLDIQKNLKSWLPELWSKIKTHKKLKRMLNLIWHTKRAHFLLCD